MAGKVDFKNVMKNEIKEVEKQEKKVKANSEEIIPKFTIEKKKKEKATRKTFPMYMEKEQLERIDKVCKKTGYNRNELINKMIDFCLENIELK